MQALADPITDRLDTPSTAPPPDLSWLPGFSEDDIRQNEAGLLSEAERSRLIDDMAMNWVGVGVVAIFAAVPVLAAADLAYGAVLLALPIAIGIVCSRSFVRSLESAKVAAAEGDVTIESDGGGEDPLEYSVLIGDLKLGINGQLAEHIKPGGPYRVFYLTRSHCLVAAKALPGWRAAAVAPTKRSALWALLRDPAAGLTGRLERGVGERRRRDRNADTA